MNICVVRSNISVNEKICKVTLKKIALPSKHLLYIDKDLRSPSSYQKI